MTRKEIKAILGFDKSTISRILNGRTNGYSSGTVNEVTLLAKLGVSYFDEIFKMKQFMDICDTVIEKGSTRDDKNIVDIIKFTCLCKSRSLTLTNPEEAKTLEEVFGKYYEDTSKLIENPLFEKMCAIAIRKHPPVRFFGSKLISLSIILQDIKTKTNKVNGKSDT
jgi:transcriptional regulator with XRE-family HTH domain